MDELERPDSTLSRAGQMALESRSPSRPAGVADHRDALDLDLHPGPCEVRHRDEGAAWKRAGRKHLSADLDEPVAVARFLDEHRHRDEIRERSADAPERLIHQLEHSTRLSLEVAGDVLAGAIHGGRLPGQPYDAPALGDDGRRVGASPLSLARLEEGLLHQ